MEKLLYESQAQRNRLPLQTKRGVFLTKWTLCEKNNIILKKFFYVTAWHLFTIFPSLFLPFSQASQAQLCLPKDQHQLDYFRVSYTGHLGSVFRKDF